jgi:protocatechuate 3,4-dioxygenase beta subunit
MKLLVSIAFVLCSFTAACCQPADNPLNTSSLKPIGGRCEDCEAILEYESRSKSLTWVDTLPDFNDAGPKLEITGTIFKRDGKTPAANVILYIYHTDQSGEYPKKEGAKGSASQHGYIRGWIKTNTDGKYKFYTLKPGAYPGGGNPAHIHPIILEDARQVYWIDEYLFDNDPILTDKIRQQQPGRGGSGILKTKADRNGMLVARRNIVLGLNIPGYE